LSTGVDITATLGRTGARVDFGRDNRTPNDENLAPIPTQHPATAQVQSRGGPMQRLSGIDSMFVALESPTNLFHVGAVAVFDPSTAPTGSAPPHEMLRRVVENRIHRIPPFTKTLVEVPGGVDHPWWVDTSDVDLSHHLRQGCLPPPGGESELAGYAAQVLSRPLDRKRPLWEIHTVEGLEGGLVAGVAKIHHSAVDGIAGTEVTAELMDLTPEVRLFDEEDQRPTSIPNPRPLRLVSSAIANAARRVVPAAKTLGQLPLTAAGIRRRHPSKALGHRSRRLSVLTEPQLSPRSIGTTWRRSGPLPG
jgi:WS/DGAT/MGAT family acyltransferase